MKVGLTLSLSAVGAVYDRPRPVGPIECSDGRKAVVRVFERRSPVGAKHTHESFAPTGLPSLNEFIPRPCGHGYILTALRAWAGVTPS
jgi:hypothetical protein